ncbi:MAG: PAS domain-containing hybrid sensor histidine kinase/response regulator, partial [Myxococcota bacterium]
GVLRLYGACRDVTDQRRAEDERRGVEERYRAITENSWDIIGELDPVGMPTYISPNIREVLGWEPEELIASQNPDLVHPDDRPAISEQIAKMLQGASEARMELRVRHKEGGWRNIELTATAFHGADGLRRGVFLGRDVTERLQMKAERERLGSVVEASSELIAIFEPEGRLLFMNRAGRRMTGLGSRGLGTTSLFDLMSLSEATRLRQEALDSALHETAWEGECRIQPLDGEAAFPVLANAFRLPDPRRGEESKVALVARDIRARKRAENALHESEQRFRTLVENAFDLIAEIDEDGNFLYASPRYRELLGYDPEGLIDQPVLDLLHAEDRARIEALSESFEERPLTDLGPLRVRSRDGAWHWLEIQVRPYRRGSGESVLVVVCRDVTGRRATEAALRLSQEQLLQSQKMEAIGRLAGGVAHDFNNLLTAITGYGDLIYQELGEGDPLREDTAEILRASEQASSLTRQLLAFSRRQVVQPQVVEINGLVSDVDRLLRRLMGEQVDLVTSLAPDVGPVRVDPGQIEQLLVNLAVNARDAMPHGGRLEIRTDALQVPGERAAHPGIPEGEWIRLMVSDTGEGMSEETAERIFEPFFTTKDSSKGTGLGLSTVYGIVQQSGGQIRVDTGPRRGTTFTIYLPRSAAAPDPAHAHPVVKNLRGTETVVLVEDEETVRRLLTRYLEEHGYPVLAAASAVEALRAVRRHEGPIDVLITDVRLPKMDGHALAERLRWDHPGLSVLFVSGFSEDEFAPHALADEEHAFIQKPFSPPHLLHRLRALLASR